MILTKSKTLADCHPEDLGDTLMQIAESLEITFETGELDHIHTFGELCDHIIAKMKGNPTSDCTTQQAFYKIRNAFAETLNIDRKIITPESKLCDFLPVTTRREQLRKVEKQLGFKLFALEPPLWISLSLGLLFIYSLFKLIFHWQLGLAGIFGSLLLIAIANRLGNVLSWDTMGEMADYLSKNNYIKMRRNPESFNPQEVKAVILHHFTDILGIEESALQPESPIR